MSDATESVTRKLPGGAKIVEGMTDTTDATPGGNSASHVEKKRKLVNGDIRSMFTTTKATTSHDKEDTKDKKDEAEGSVAPVVKPVKSLSPAEQAIMDLEKTMGADWYEALQDEFKQSYFRSIRNLLIAEIRKKSTVYPATENIFSWSRLTKLEKVKVIILGQDPYHGPNQAHGLSFSVMEPTRPPPSLVNIYKEMKNSVPGFVIPKSGDLTLLAEAGVLWLNTSLTVRAGEPASHSKIGWQTFTRAALEAVLARPSHRGVVFMVWGAHAQKAIAGLDSRKNLILKSVHPSPLSASRGFFGCNHFAQANKWIAEKYGPDEQIDWTVICPK